MGLGLRRGEIVLARWEHFITRQGRIWFSGAVGRGEVVGKDYKLIEVPIQDIAWQKLEPFREKEGFVLGDGHSVEWTRELGSFMTRMGWKTQKKAHELRALAGSFVYQQNPHDAMRFLRHKTMRMTETKYVRYGATPIATNALSKALAAQPAPAPEKKPEAAPEQKETCLCW